MAVLQLLLAIGVLLGIGLLVFRLIERRESAGFWTGWLGFGFGVGLGLECLGMFYLASWRVQLSLLNIASLLAGLILLLALIDPLILRCLTYSKTSGASGSWTWLELLMA